MPELITADSQARTWIEYDWAAMRSNAIRIRELVAPAALLPVIKANAYGHAAGGAALALRGLADCFAVANLREALDLRSKGVTGGIVLLGPCLPAEREDAVREGFLPTVSSAEEAGAFLSIAPDARLHFKIDTGMGRLGAWREEALAELDQIRQLGAAENVGMISTHLAAADESPHRTLEQLEWFESAVRSLRHAFHNTRFHALNSAGILRFPDHAHDMVRPGLLLYGISPLPEFAPQFHPVMAWKARVAMVREFPPGRALSYGGEFITRQRTRVAILPVGYADGYFRQIPSGTACVLLHGARCPVIGRITMDMILADVTGIEPIAEGDIATLVGRDGSAEITASELAQWAGTIPWHVLTAVGPRPHSTEISPPTSLPENP